MQRLKKQFEAQIIKKYGSKRNWLSRNDVHSQRFYNFLKGEYNPTIMTLSSWLKTLDLELTATECKKPHK